MNTPSGKFVLRIAPDLHLRFKQDAQAHKLSLNQYIVNLLSTSGPEPALVAALRPAYKDSLVGVVLFGATVHGDKREHSEVNLLIILKDSQSIDRSLYKLWDEMVAEKVGSLYAPQFSHLPKIADLPTSLWLEVALEGEILFDGMERPIHKYLRTLRETVASGAFHRKLSHGHPYWIETKLPDVK